MGGCGATNTAALAFGGFTAPSLTLTGNAETWNGTSWSEVNNLNTAGRSMGTAGTNTAALAISGAERLTGVEEWSGPAVQTVNITVS